jgi:hypothetical protein
MGDIEMTRHTNRTLGDETCSRRGAVLGVVMVLVLVVTTLGSGMIALSGASAIEVSNAISATQAFWAAEAGLERVKSTIAKSPVTALESIAVFDQNATLAGPIGGHGYSVTYTLNVVTNSSYTITSTGTSRGGVARQVKMDAWLQPVSKYMDAWNLSGRSPGYPSRFHDGDTLDGDGIGEMYFNSPVNIDGYPLFKVPVVLTGDRVSFQNLSRTEDDGTVFTEGITLNASPLNVLSPGDPDYIDFMGVLESAAADDGLSLNGDHEIVFYDNGTLTYQSVDKGGAATGPLLSYGISVGNGSIYVNGDVSVSGEVRGSVTLAAASDLTIIDDITYASASKANHSDIGFNKGGITDVLGLIAGRSAMFSKELSDVNIHASIIAVEGSFHRAGSTGVYTGAVNLFGGIIRYTGGGDHPQWPGAKNYLYDVRLLASPPPFFPRSGYEYSSWRQAR